MQLILFYLYWKSLPHCMLLTIENQQIMSNSKNKSLDIFSNNLFKESLVMLIQAAYSSPELNYSQAFIGGHAIIHREKYGVRNSMAQEITYDVKQ